MYFINLFKFYPKNIKQSLSNSDNYNMLRYKNIKLSKLKYIMRNYNYTYFNYF